MKKQYFTLKYISGLPAEYFKSYGELPPSTCALLWCMQKTEVARIFTRDDLHEFFYRLPLVFYLKEPITPRKKADPVINYYFNGTFYPLSLDDINMHFGLEAYDHFINHTMRERYIIRLEGVIEFAMKVGYNSYFEQLEMVSHIMQKGNTIYPPKITAEMLDRADRFAADMMKLVPGEVFSRKGKARCDKEKELTARQQRINNLKMFDINKIPADILRKCLLEAYTEENVNHLMDNPAELKRKTTKMLYVGWVYANCFMKQDGTLSDEKKSFILDFMDYEIEGEGGFHKLGMSNLTYNVEFSNIEVIAPYLNGIEVF